MTNPSTDPLSWVGHPVTGAAGEPLGRVVTVFTDPGGAATWAAVDLGDGSTLVPLDRARAVAGSVQVPYDADRLRTAPRHDPAAPLQQDEADRLVEHYAERASDWTVRHEEQLRVRTETVVTGRVRVRRYAVTERRTFTVDVTREEISIVHEPVDGGPAGEPGEPGEGLSEEVLELVRHEERVVISKEVVPVERVRVVRRVVTRPQEVHGEVRRDVVDVQEERFDRR